MASSEGPLLVSLTPSISRAWLASARPIHSCRDYMILVYLVGRTRDQAIMRGMSASKSSNQHFPIKNWKTFLVEFLHIKMEESMPWIDKYGRDHATAVSEPKHLGKIPMNIRQSSPRLGPLG